jgi:hypothetical protein
VATGGLRSRSGGIVGCAELEQLAAGGTGNVDRDVAILPPRRHLLGRRQMAKLVLAHQVGGARLQITFDAGQEPPGVHGPALELAAVGGRDKKFGLPAVQFQRRRTVGRVRRRESDLRDIELLHVVQHAHHIGAARDIGGLRIDDRQAAACENFVDAFFPAGDRARAHRSARRPHPARAQSARKQRPPH